MQPLTYLLTAKVRKSLLYSTECPKEKKRERWRTIYETSFFKDDLDAIFFRFVHLAKLLAIFNMVSFVKPKLNY